MEGTIAMLLKDFEDGQLSRRQLIQSLAMVAMTGSTAAATGTQAPRQRRHGRPCTWITSRMR